MGRILTRLTRAAAGTAADARLLDAFVSDRDEPAFRGLVERHGPMVFGVCLRLLRNRQDAEDAFQATFLVLARRAADVWPRTGVGSWLYGVAYRVALKARSVRARRLGREQSLGETDVAAVSGEPQTADLRDAIDRAINKLPEVYRAAVVACDLEGRSRREAAEQLGWKEGTLSGRLARARQILAERLRRSGLALPAGGVAAALGVGEAAPAVGSNVVENTVRVATGALAAGVPAAVAILTEGVVPGMVLVNLKTAAVAVLASCMIGVGVWASAGTGNGPGDKPGTGKGTGAGTLPLPASEPGDDARVQARSAFHEARRQVEAERESVALGKKEAEAAQLRLAQSLHNLWEAENRLKAAHEKFQTAPTQNPQPVSDAAGVPPPGPPVKKAGDKSSDVGKSDQPADLPLELLILQGRWAMIHERMDPPPRREVGLPVPGGAYRVLIRGDKMVWSRETDPDATGTLTFTLRVGSSQSLSGPGRLAEIDLIREDGTRLLGFMAMAVPNKGGTIPVLLCIASPPGLEKAGERPKDFKPGPGRSLYTLLPLSEGGDQREQDFLNRLQVTRDLIDADHQLNEAKRRLAEAQAVLPPLQTRRDNLAEHLRKESEKNPPAPPDARNPATEPRMKAEVDHQRDQAHAAMAETNRLRKELQDWKDKAASLDIERKRTEDKLRGIQTDLAALQERLKVLEAAAPSVEAKAAGKADPPGQIVAVADENGKYLPIPEALQEKIQKQAVVVFNSTRGEVPAAEKGTAFAGAERWKRAEQSGHVKLWFPKKQTWHWNWGKSQVTADYMLLPMTDRRAPV